MSAHSPPRGHDTLTAVQARHVDALCNRFEAEWKVAADGVLPRIEDYLQGVSEPELPVLLKKLILVDIDYLQHCGLQPRLEDYLARFPALDREEFAEAFSTLSRPEADLPPTPPPPASATLSNDVPYGIKLRCPHCQNPIQLLDDRPDEVLCPGCGGSFQVREARHTDTASSSRMLGKFQLLERVGLGAFGAVWRARDTDLDRIVALKIPHSGLLTAKEDLERFHREARAAAQLRHPGIVTVHEVATLDGLPTIVSDFVTGVPLKDLLEVRRLTIREAARLTVEVAEALEYAHTMGLVHRDIKPAL